MKTNNENTKKFTIIVTFYETSSYLEKCIYGIKSILKKNVEVILVSETLLDLKSYEVDERFIFIHTPGVYNPGEKRNIAASKAKGNILCFIDDDAYPSSDWLVNANAFYSNEENIYTCIGGPGNLPQDDNNLSRAINLFFISKFFYPFPERYLQLQEKKFFSVNDWPTFNLFVPKIAFNKIGGFNLNYWPGEDTKLCNDLINNNYKIAYYSDILVFHYRRINILKHCKQLFRYGFYRNKFFFDGLKNSKSLKFFIPALFTIYIVILIFLRDINFVFLPLAIYLFLLFIDMLRSFKFEKNILILILSRIVIPISHFSYGFGQIVYFISRCLGFKIKTGLKR